MVSSKGYLLKKGCTPSTPGVKKRKTEKEKGENKEDLRRIENNTIAHLNDKEEVAQSMTTNSSTQRSHAFVNGNLDNKAIFGNKNANMTSSCLSANTKPRSTTYG